MKLKYSSHYWPSLLASLLLQQAWSVHAEESFSARLDLNDSKSSIKDISITWKLKEHTSILQIVISNKTSKPGDVQIIHPWTIWLLSADGKVIPASGPPMAIKATTGLAPARPIIISNYPVSAFTNAVAVAIKWGEEYHISKLSP